MGVWNKTFKSLLYLREGWRIFETETGYLGLGPEGVQAGDEIYILNRCTVPVILRRGVGMEDGTAMHVGTCFVAGLMNGEAVEFIRSGKSTPKWIILQ